MTHPVHPAVVHFPVACWSLATLADLASLRWGEPAWMFAGMLLVIGTLGGLAAMASGLPELRKLAADDPAGTDLNRHIGLVMTAWCLYATSLVLRLHGTTLQAPDASAISLGVAGFIVLVAGGWFGGKLAHRHGIGGRRP